MTTTPANVPRGSFFGASWSRPAFELVDVSSEAPDNDDDMPMVTDDPDSEDDDEKKVRQSRGQSFIRIPGEFRTMFRATEADHPAVVRQPERVTASHHGSPQSQVRLPLQRQHKSLRAPTHHRKSVVATVSQSSNARK